MSFRPKGEIRLCRLDQREKSDCVVSTKGRDLIIFNSYKFKISRSARDDSKNGFFTRLSFFILRHPLDASPIHFCLLKIRKEKNRSCGYSGAARYHFPWAMSGVSGFSGMINLFCIMLIAVVPIL